MRLVEAVPGGWVVNGGAAVAAVTGVAVPPLNVVFALEADAEDAVHELLDDVAHTALPYCLQLRSGASAQQLALARERGMTRIDDVPLMVLGRVPEVRPVEPQAGLMVRQLRPDEAALHARVAAAGFEAPAQPFLQLMTPSVLNVAGLRCYLGQVEDDAVTTGFGITTGDVVGVFNVATVPLSRGHGFGSALTARIITDANANGAQWAVLQSSAAGYSVYERIGFRTVERWQCWISST